MVPVLSPGKHRNPRKGACFMEYASLLAGERWSDHPSCTHPLLAAVARHVNDHTSDANRSDLAGLIPSVIGVTGDDPRIDATIAIRCAATAIPVVAEYRQRALAVSLLAAQRFVANLHRRNPSNDDAELSGRAHAGLDRAAHAARWAETFTAGHDLNPKAFRRQSAPATVRVAVIGIAEAAIPDPDRLLHELLTTVIRDCTDRLGSDSPARTRFIPARAIR